MACLQRCIATVCPAFNLLAKSNRSSVALSGVRAGAAAGQQSPSSQAMFQTRRFCVSEKATALCGFVRKFYVTATQWHAAKGQKIDVVKINIVEPALGKKICPNNVHPLEYLSALPGLRGLNLDEDLECTYFSQKTHSTIKIQCPADWSAFLNEGQPELEVRVTQRPVVATRRTGQVRGWCQALINVGSGEESKMAGCLKNMKDLGYRNIYSFGVIWVERGHKKDDWKEVVNTFVENGLPQQFKKPLVLAAEATKGSSTGFQSNLFDRGQRIHNCTKYRVMPGEKPGTVDGFVALYNFRASTPIYGHTDMDTEEAFKTYVELDAKRRWRDEAEQLDLEE